jgi:hypothetical protein
MPMSLLEPLRTQFPSVRICVNNESAKFKSKSGIRRADIGSRLDPNTQLYSQAYSLKFHVAFCFGVPHHEFRLLGSILAGTTHLRKLYLDSSTYRYGYGGHNGFSNAQDLNMHMDIEGVPEHMQEFPPLEELAVKSYHYFFSASHCELWKKRMDWTHLRRLEFSHGSPEHFFLAFTGALPSLEALTFKYQVCSTHSRPVCDWHRFWTCSSERIIAQFLDALSPLKELQVYVAPLSDGFRQVGLPAIQRHGPSLRKFGLFRYDGTSGIDDLQDILYGFDTLEELGLMVELKEETDGALIWVSLPLHYATRTLISPKIPVASFS